MNPTIKKYTGKVAACGAFCGGCPYYTREKKPCPGAEINSKKCEGCKSFHLCCKGKEISHCYECAEFPCKRFSNFSRQWYKYGQDLIENQKLLKDLGRDGFISYYNLKAKE